MKQSKAKAHQAIWWLFEYIVVMKTLVIGFDSSHYKMGFRFYVIPLYFAISLI